MILTLAVFKLSGVFLKGKEMAKIKVGKRDGGIGLTKGHATSSASALEDVLNALVKEVTYLRADNVALKQKLDVDTGVAFDDYESILVLPESDFDI